MVAKGTAIDARIWLPGDFRSPRTPSCCARTSNTSFRGDGRWRSSGRSDATPAASCARSFRDLLTPTGPFHGIRAALMVDNAEVAGAAQLHRFPAEVGRYFSVNRMLTMDSVKLRLESASTSSHASEFSPTYRVLQAYTTSPYNARRRHPARSSAAPGRSGAICGGIDLKRRMVSALFLSLLPLRHDHHRLRRQDGQDWHRVAPTALSPYNTGSEDFRRRPAAFPGSLFTGVRRIISGRDCATTAGWNKKGQKRAGGAGHRAHPPPWPRRCRAEASGKPAPSRRRHRRRAASDRYPHKDELPPTRVAHFDLELGLRRFQRRKFAPSPTTRMQRRQTHRRS